MPKFAVKLPPSLSSVIASGVTTLEEPSAIAAVLGEVIASLPEPAYLLDRSHRWVYVNQAYCEYMGSTRAALLGITARDILTPAEANSVWENDDVAFKTGETIVNESVMADGVSVPRVLQTRKTIVRAPDEQLYLFGTVRDLTGTEDARQLLRGTAARAGEPACTIRNLGYGQIRFVFSDPLTQLPNRRAAMNLIDTIAARGDCDTAVLLLNIDHFSLVNERFGHSLGDAAILEVAQRLRGAIDSRHTLGRLDNDEFVVIAEQCGPMQADLLAKQILSDIAAPMQLGNHDYRVSASIGIALMPEHGRTASELVRNAGLAMRWCKQRRRGQSERYLHGASAAAERRATIELRLPAAIDNGRIAVHYQPFIDGATSELRGFEALARWSEPELGVIEPAEFIPIAEGMGIIRRLGQDVLERACEMAATLDDDSLTVSVNVSSVQLLDETFPIAVAEILQRCEISGERLLLEITETVAMAADDTVAQTLKELSDIGIRLLIDDFGTGFSNLARLKALPICGIKIDRDFVRDLPDSPEDSAIFRAAHAIATAMGLMIIVEGIENKAQDEFVRQFPVDYLQGYRFGRPLPVKKLSRYTR
ncbi:MAG: sensor domain-containing protein [Gammaproteobacteria bacterium]|jgi:diguanylate cyclase (GGDEF)-like protein/PAS domain S-box-containing protein